MEKAVPYIDEGVLVQVRVPDPVASHVVVVDNRDVIVDLVLRHDVQISLLTLHTLTTDSRSAWLLREQGNTSVQLKLDHCRTEPEPS